MNEGKGEKFVLYSNLYSDNTNLNIWKLIKIKDNLFFIKSEYVFRIIKLYEEIGKLTSDQMKMIENEPIDLFMKYIDLTDKNLKRKG